jgi:hypothetical protein
MSNQATNAEDLFGFSELEDRLLGEDGAEVMRVCLGQTLGVQADMETLIHQGLAAEDFAVASAVIDATKAAVRILATSPAPLGAQR